MNRPVTSHAGLEVVVGSMFSGKSEELIRRVKRAVIARRNVQVFKPVIDDRYGVEVVRSHDGDSCVARPVRSSQEIPALIAPGTTVIGIDEAQFFDPGIVSVVRSLVAGGRRVICAGLDLDFPGGARWSGRTWRPRRTQRPWWSRGTWRTGRSGGTRSTGRSGGTRSTTWRPRQS